MEVKEALKKIHAPQSQTTLMAAIKVNDFEILNDYKDVELTLELANEKIAKFEQRLESGNIEHIPEGIRVVEGEIDVEETKKLMQSDAVYWGVLSRLRYWKAVRRILEAAETNGGQVADVEAPNFNCMLMECLENLDKHAEKVFEETQKL